VATPSLPRASMPSMEFFWGNSSLSLRFAGWSGVFFRAFGSNFGCARHQSSRFV
jgi:hypothetical protein